MTSAPSQQTQIGKGGYGKVYRIPHPTRTGQFALKKVFKQNQWTQQKKQSTRKITNLLNRIDPEHKYFAGTMIQQRQQSMVMQDAGMSLDKCLSTFKGEEKKEFLFDVMENFGHLCEGVDLLRRNGLIHGDIKLENIVWNQTTKQLRFIDYDFLGSKEDYEKASAQNINYPHVPKNYFYQYWPLERFAPCFLLVENLDKLERARMFAPRYCEEVKSIIFNNFSLWREDVMKIDVYSLGLVAMDLLLRGQHYKYFGQGQDEHKALKAKFDQMILGNMLHPIPSHRHLLTSLWKKIGQYVKAKRPASTSPKAQSQKVSPQKKPSASTTQQQPKTQKQSQSKV